MVIGNSKEWSNNGKCRNNGERKHQRHLNTKNHSSNLHWRKDRVFYLEITGLNRCMVLNIKLCILYYMIHGSYRVIFWPIQCLYRNDLDHFTLHDKYWQLVLWIVQKIKIMRTQLGSSCGWSVPFILIYLL